MIRHLIARCMIRIQSITNARSYFYWQKIFRFQHITLIVNPSMGHSEQNASLQQKDLLGLIWHKMIHQRLFYLFFFTIGSSVTLIISVFFTGQTLDNIKVIEICILSVAVIVKTIEVFKKLTLKELLKTQSQFPIPYLFTILNIFLLIEVCGYLNQYQPSNTRINVEYAIIESLRFFFMTYMCSLITNKKTTSKVEYWYYTIIIVVVVCCDVYIIVLKVRDYGAMIDSMNDQLEENLIGYIKGPITQQTYQSVKNTVGAQQTAIENASNLDIACVASVVANYLVMMDMIGRPLEKIKEKSHLLHEVTATFGDKSEKNDIKYTLLNDNIAVNHSILESDRSHSERNGYETSQAMNNRASKMDQIKNVQLETRKSNL